MPTFQNKCLKCYFYFRKVAWTLTAFPLQELVILFIKSDNFTQLKLMNYF